MNGAGKLKQLLTDILQKNSENLVAVCLQPYWKKPSARVFSWKHFFQNNNFAKTSRRHFVQNDYVVKPSRHLQEFPLLIGFRCMDISQEEKYFLHKRGIYEQGGHWTKLRMSRYVI